MALAEEDSDEEQDYGVYRILRLIGEGGMGMVYLAEQRQPIVRQVALKVIKLGMDTREVIARFESERQALALMDHPNIAKVLDAGATPQGRPYFVMEYVPGAPITEFCDRNRMSNRRRLELFIEVCQAVQHAHQKGIIHRDIKASNVLVWQQDDLPILKVIDFGVAKAVNRRLTEKTVYTDLGILIGTPEYMSPEQAQTSEDLDTTTDIYSLGVLLYELLCGALPFDSRSLRAAAYDEIRRIIREEEPARPSARFASLGAEAGEVARRRQTEVAALARDLRGDLSWITMKAMAKDRTRRYASASELAADIARHLRDEPVMAGPPSASYRLGKFIRKNRGPVLAIAAVFVSLLLGLGASTILYFRAEGQRLEAQAQRAEAERQRAVAEQERAEARRQGSQAEQQRALAEGSRMTANAQRLEAELQHAEAERQRAAAEQQSNQARLRGAEALQERSIAQQQRALAEQQSRAAREQSQLAQEQRASAEGQRLIAQRQSYAANLIAADLHIRSNEVAEARRRLFLCPPELRGWEWRYLFWKSDTSLATLAGHAGAGGVKPALGFSQDGKRLFRAVSDAMDWWSTSSYKPGAGFRDLGQVLAADRDGSRVVSTSGRNGDYGLRLFDTVSNKVSALGRQGSQVKCAAFSRTGERVVSGDRDGVLQIWDAESGKPLARFDGHKGATWSVAFSGDGRRIVSAGEDRMIRVWDAATGHAMYGISGHGGPVSAAEFSLDRRIIVSGSADKTARIWDAATGRPLSTLTGHECGVRGIAISPDGATVVSASCSTLRLWDTVSGKLISTLAADWRGEIAAVAFSSNGARIAAATESGDVKVWDAPTYGGGILRRAGAGVDRIAVAPTGTHIALHNARGPSLEVWDTRSRKPVWALRGNQAQITAMALSPDPGFLATGSENALHLWNASTGKQVSTSIQLPGPATLISFSRDGTRLITGSSDRGAAVWDLRSMRRIPGVTLGAPIRAVAPSPDGRHFAAALGDQTLTVCDAESDARLRLGLPAGSGAVAAIAYDPDGKRIAAGMERNGDIGVWDARSGHLLAVLKGHSASVDALAFSPDGSRIVSGSRDQNLRLWDASTYDPLLVMGDRDESFASLVFSPDGARLYSVSLDGTVRVWETRMPGDAK